MSVVQPTSQAIQVKSVFCTFVPSEAHGSFEIGRNINIICFSGEGGQEVIVSFVGSVGSIYFLEWKGREERRGEGRGSRQLAKPLPTGCTEKIEKLTSEGYVTVGVIRYVTV